MKRGQLLYLFALACSLVQISCNTRQKPAGVVAAAQKKPETMPPFRYHKLIEVSPGQDYDVLSWGRGASAVGAFGILHSDSAASKYTTTTGDLDGAIVDVFNTDMDLDGNPEIIIQAKGNDTINYTHIYAFEFTNGKAQKLDFPRLTKPQRQGYRGGDNFYVQDGKLFREFPVYDVPGANTKLTGPKRLFEYGLRDNSFTVKQLNKDLTKVSQAVKPVVKETVNNSKPEKHSTIKKHTSEKKKKKKHRRHRSGE